jgi:enhancing lycopene biosynthesis protein 2
MRVLTSLLKPAAYLLLGASAVFGCSAAQALTFNWSASAVPSGSSAFVSGSGSGTFEANLSSGTTTYTMTSISGSWNSDAIIGPGTLAGADNTFDYAGDGTLNVNGAGFAFQTATAEYNLFYGGGGYGAANNMCDGPFGGGGCVNDGLVTISSVAAVPAPLPILGIPPVLVYCRKLKKRIKARRDSSSPALI